MTYPDRTKAPDTHPFPTLHLPKIERFTLGNGIKVVNIPGGDMPGCRIDIEWPTGTADSENLSAIKLMAASLNQGTESHTSAEIADILDYNGAVLSVVVTDHFTRMTLYSLNEALDRLLPLINEIVSVPTFPTDELTTLRDNMAAKTRVSLRRVATIAAIESHRHLFGDGHPRARFDQPEKIMELTRDDVISAYIRAIKGIAPTIYVTGMTAPVLPRLNAMLSGWKVDANDFHKNILPMNPSTGRYHYAVPDAQQSAVRIVIPTINREHPDYVDLRVAIHALGGYFGSRLMSNIREEKGYTYGINGALYGYREGGAVIIQSEADPRYVDDLIKETFNEIDRLGNEPMDEAELQNVRNSEINSLISTLDTPFSVCDYVISCDNNHAGENYYERQMAAATGISAERITQLIAHHVDPSRAIIDVAGKN